MNKKSIDYRSILSRLWRYIRPYKWKLILSIISALISSVLTLFFPLLTGKAVDGIIDGDTGLFFRILMMMVLSVGLSAVFQYLMNLLNNSLSYSIVRDMRKDAFAHLERLPLSYIDSHSHGDVVSRIISDADQVSDGLLMGFTQLFTGIITILGTLVFMFTVNWVVALVVVVVTPLSIFSASFIAKRTFTLFYKQSEWRGKQTAFINEMVSGASTVAAYGMEEENQKHFENINKEWAHYSLLSVFYSSLTNPVTRFVNSVVYTGVALSGGLAALSGLMTIGGLTTILSYASQYTKPFNEITGVMTEFQNAAASAGRIFAFMDAEEESDDSKLPSMDKTEGNVSFDHVFFSYVPERPLIKDLELDIKPGMKVAIVGPTGAGKTTIINLLMRFYDPQSGRISIDGHDISSVRRSSIRSSFGMVLQETWLRTGTIRENIVMGRKDASDEDIKRAVELCHLDTFIASLPHGLDEMIADDSDGISQGQKQLLSISRIMLSEPEMLILDEATSSIDTRTEMYIQDAFMHLMEGRTSFIVAHRLQTIKNADLILVIDHGDVVEKGTHKELMAKKGFYHNLYMSQFAKR